ncbi:unnamed protein product [Prunus armeniaca]|uniref:Uncharacterized protein n=1 Tax=Prunus armeniaca TaxID=36596 RepID=A0A6J5Y3L5_PRUAR|nr:unnamed protein product [Prunus armeniaca]
MDCSRFVISRVNISDSVSEESISANSSSEYSLLLSLKNSILELMVGLSRNT